MSELKFEEVKDSTKTYFHQSLNELVRDFNSDLDQGLTSSEMEFRYEKSGYNELPKIKKSIWKIYLAPIFNFLILILLVTGIIIVILGEGDTQIITFTVVAINSVTAIIQQFRAQKALESLREISALKTTVIRDGKEYEIKTRELVPGDIVLLKQGDKVPADGRIIEQMNLSVDEAPLTGESEPVEKKVIDLDNKKISLQNQCNMVFMGTYIQTGRAKELITGTGGETEIGKISQTLNEMGNIEDIPLTRKLNRLGYILGTIVIINLIILVIFKLTILSLNPLEFVQENIVSAISDSIIRSMNIVPINLPLLSTLVLVTGVLAMAQTGVVIKNLSAIESLGRVSIIASDKTGTITKNEMTVEKFWINQQEYNVTGAGYEAEGQIFKEDKQVRLTDNRTFARFLDAIVINNNAKLEFKDIKVRLRDKKEKAVRKAFGSPTEAALLVLTEKTGLNTYDIKKKYNITKEFSFSSETKKMTTICTTSEEKIESFVFSKGAPERMLEISSYIEINGIKKELDANYKSLISGLINKRANQGYRILAIAYNRLKINVDSKREDAEKDLIFLGFVSIMDPPRLGVRESVEVCQTGGIKVVMITGDHPATAKTIASEMGIHREKEIVATGDQLENLPLPEFNMTTVFARVEPSDKEFIVETYQKQNLITAMTGDGINDSPALKLANAGIAMGITGTDLAKETSDMVITDDNFSSIIQGVKTGRGIFSKIRTIIFFFICVNIMEGILFFTFEVLAPFIGFQLFASNWQHIYIFAIMHTLPSIALVIDSHPKDVMKEPPRNEEQLLNKNLWLLLLFQAFLGGLGIFLALTSTLNGTIPLNIWNTNPSLSYIPLGSTQIELVHMKARTMFITTIYIFEAFFIWTFRRPNKSAYRSIKEEMSYSILFICLFALGIHIFIVLFSSQVNSLINNIVGFELNFLFLSFEDWLICISLAMPGLLGVEIIKFIARKKKIYY